MNKRKKTMDDGTQQELLENRELFGRMFMATINVICGSVAEQKLGLETIIDILKSDVMCAKRMLRILDATPAIERKHPELRALCEHTCGRR